jgi:hypothetical protein
MSVYIGWWILPVIATVFSFRWAFNDEHTRGDYNFSVVYTLPMAGFMSVSAWAVYFAVMWWLA